MLVDKATTKIDSKSYELIDTIKREFKKMHNDCDNAWIEERLWIVTKSL